MPPSLPLSANTILIDSSCRPFRLPPGDSAHISFSLRSDNSPDIRLFLPYTQSMPSPILPHPALVPVFASRASVNNNTPPRGALGALGARLGPMPLHVAGGGLGSGPW